MAHVFVFQRFPFCHFPFFIFFSAGLRTVRHFFVSHPLCECVPLSLISMDLTLSRMTNSDLEAALDLWGQTEGVGLNESDTPDRLRAYLDRNPGLSLIARDGARLVGAALCGHDGRRGYLHHLAVLREYRGRGLGRRMVESCLASLAAIGIIKCNIFLYADNEPGKQFWNRCGWSARNDLSVLQRKSCREAF